MRLSYAEARRRGFGRKAIAAVPEAPKPAPIDTREIQQANERVTRVERRAEKLEAGVKGAKGEAAAALAHSQGLAHDLTEAQLKAGQALMRANQANTLAADSSARAGQATRKVVELEPRIAAAQQLAAEALQQAQDAARDEGLTVANLELDGNNLVVTFSDGSVKKILLPESRRGGAVGGGSGDSIARTVVKEVDADYTVSSHDLHVVMNSSEARTVTLFDTSLWGNRIRSVTNIGAGLLTLTGAQTISGVASIAIKRWRSVDLIVAAGNWVIK